VATVDYARLIPKAWVNFTGSGVVAIKDDENVASITDHGVGLYTINFIDSFAAADYCYVSMARDSVNNVCVSGEVSVAATSSSHRIRVVVNENGVLLDPEDACLAYLGALA
jgi:hypothetical protein